MLFSFKNFFSHLVVYADGKTSTVKFESLTVTVFVWYGITFGVQRDEFAS